MRLTTLGGITGLSLLLGLSAVAPGCGGGGGGGGGGAACPPGTLQAVALEGGSAPGTTGAFGPFGPDVIVDLADDGWTAFVGDVVGDLSTDRGVYVRTPGGLLTLVFAEGDAAPPPIPGGTFLNGFERVHVTKHGKVVVLAELSDGGEAFVTASVDSGSGAVSDRDAAIATGNDLPSGAGPAALDPGLLEAVDDDRIAVDDDADVFFFARGTTGVHGLWTVRADGSSLTAVAVEGDTVPAGATGKFGASFEGLGINANGALVAWACTIVNGTATDGIFAANTAGQKVTVALQGDTAPGLGGRTFEQAFDGGPLIVFVDGTTSFVAWTSDLTGSSPDEGVFWRQTGPAQGPIVTVAGPGQTALGVTPGQYGDLRLMDTRDDPSHLAILAPITGNVDVQRVLYRVRISATPDTQVVLRDDGDAPDMTDVRFTEVFPSIVEDDVPEVAFDGGIAFSAVLSDGSASLWWARPGTCLTALAVEGGPVPGFPGGTFGDFHSFTVVTPATDAFLFRAPVAGIPGATTGLFLQR